MNKDRGHVIADKLSRSNATLKVQKREKFNQINSDKLRIESAFQQF